MNTNLVIIPARGRPKAAEEAFAALKEHSVISDFMIGLDEDDADNYPEIEGVIREVNPRLKMNGTLNLLVNKYHDKYETISFLGDDHRVRTPGWDATLYAPIFESGYGVAYGNDLFQSQDLPTAVMLSTAITKVLGFFAPPVLIHLYMDNFWRDLGTALDRYFYFNDVIIEHMHPFAGKGEMDAGYAEVNAREVGSHDQLEYQKYFLSQFKEDVIRIVKELG